MKRKLEQVEAETELIQTKKVNSNGGAEACEPAPSSKEAPASTSAAAPTAAGDAVPAATASAPDSSAGDPATAATTTAAAAAAAATAGTSAAGPPAASASDAAIAPDQDAAISESDARSVYVGNVDYGATVEELGVLFGDCGTINRVTIMTNKQTGQPKGFAYIEFADESSVKHATILDNTMFRERKLKVVPKRTNVPGMAFRGRGRGRGRGRYGRGYGRGYGRRPRRGSRGRYAPY